MFDYLFNIPNIPCRCNMPGEGRICIYDHTYYNSYRRPGIVEKHYRWDNTHD